MAQSNADPYLERLRVIQREAAVVDARIDALESGHALDVESIDSFVRERVTVAPARYEDFLSEAEIREIAKRYSLALNKGVDCDALDYAISAACGVVSGLIDAIFASLPGEGAVDEVSDDLFDRVVVRFANSIKVSEGERKGEPLWHPRAGNEDNVASAIGFLERRFKAGYDQAKSMDVSGAVEGMTPKNHHAKSAAHYPDVIGLIASICNQFTGTSTFFGGEKGQIVVVAGSDNEVEIKGKTFTAKVYAGVINWFGHCMSDISGSSGSRGRGAGLPLPFWEFFELCNFGRFPNEKGQWQSFATVMTRVYEDGYDLRHGMATTFPVLINELLVRAIYTLRRHFDRGLFWSECLPAGGSPELQRMLTVGIGSMCVVDLGHAAVASWGNWVKFFDGLNLMAWARFGLQGARDLQALAEREMGNLMAVNDSVSQEWDCLLERSRLLLVQDGAL